MRAKQKDGVLHKCPTCDTPVAESKQLGLRDFSWVNEKLPDKLGLMDFDGVLTQYKTGRVLICELKPRAARISIGARLAFSTMVMKGCDVWVIWDQGNGRVKIGKCIANGRTPMVREYTKAQAANLVRKWWEAGLK